MQSALFAAIVVHRLLTNDKPRGRRGWPKERAGDAAAWRVRELRRALRVPTPQELPEWAIYRVAAVRDSLEHVDERLDRAVRSPGIYSISDWYLSWGSLLMTPKGPTAGAEAMAGLRAFLIPAGILFFDRAELDLFALDIEMLALRNHVKEALQDEAIDGEGRLLYGGGQWIRVPATDIEARWLRWTTRRDEVRAEFGGEVPAIPWHLDGNPKPT